MDKYHIYEEVGSGQHSQVFKGREKMDIEYVAIKRVEKSRMDSVVKEVQVIHRLSSPNVLKFYDWYETRNNVWLILEFCTGGDLLTLIKQDHREPESAVRLFGVDLLAGLQQTHACGYLHGDLRPSNVLIDEYGILKLSGFGLARGVSSEQEGGAESGGLEEGEGVGGGREVGQEVCSQQQQQQQQQQNQDGSGKSIRAGGVAMAEGRDPAYMAPELFSIGEAAMSFASDFWSLGCVLYELLIGEPPFRSSEEATVEETIAREHPPGLDKGEWQGARMSTPFRDLVSWLLEKDPRRRPTWPQLLAHPFWGKCQTPSPLQMPPQPRFDRTMPPAAAAGEGASGGGAVGDDVVAAGGEEELARSRIVRPPLPPPPTTPPMSPPQEHERQHSHHCQQQRQEKQQQVVGTHLDEQRQHPPREGGVGRERKAGGGRGGRGGLSSRERSGEDNDGDLIPEGAMPSETMGCFPLPSSSSSASSFSPGDELASVSTIDSSSTRRRRNRAGVTTEWNGSSLSVTEELSGEARDTSDDDGSGTEIDRGGDEESDRWHGPEARGQKTGGGGESGVCYGRRDDGACGNGDDPVGVGPNSAPVEGHRGIETVQDGGGFSVSSVRAGAQGDTATTTERWASAHQRPSSQPPPRETAQISAGQLPEGCWEHGDGRSRDRNIDKDDGHGKSTVVPDGGPRRRQVSVLSSAAAAAAAATAAGGQTQKPAERRRAPCHDGLVVAPWVGGDHETAVTAAATTVQANGSSSASVARARKIRTTTRMPEETGADYSNTTAAAKRAAAAEALNGLRLRGRIPPARRNGGGGAAAAAAGGSSGRAGGGRTSPSVASAASSSVGEQYGSSFEEDDTEGSSSCSAAGGGGVWSSDAAAAAAATAVVVASVPRGKRRTAAVGGCTGVGGGSGSGSGKNAGNCVMTPGSVRTETTATPSSAGGAASSTPRGGDRAASSNGGERRRAPLTGSFASAGSGGSSENANATINSFDNGSGNEFAVTALSFRRAAGCYSSLASGRVSNSSWTLSEGSREAGIAEGSVTATTSGEWDGESENASGTPPLESKRPIATAAAEVRRRIPPGRVGEAATGAGGGSCDPAEREWRAGGVEEGVRPVRSPHAGRERAWNEERRRESSPPPPPPPPPASSVDETPARRTDGDGKGDAFCDGNGGRDLVRDGPVDRRDAGRGRGLRELLLHTSDAQVTPIVGCRSVDSTGLSSSSGVHHQLQRSSSTPSSSARVDQLPFEALHPAAVSAMPPPCVEAHLTLAYNALTEAAAPARQKGQTLVYLQSLAPIPRVANLLVNSTFLVVLLRLLRRARPVAIRETVATLIGLLVRHATYIAPGAGRAPTNPTTLPGETGQDYPHPDGTQETDGLMSALIAVVTTRESQDARGRAGQTTALRRNAVAALGELLFYVVTQEPHTPSPAVGNTGVERGGVGGDADSWSIPVVAVGNALRKSLLVGGAGGGAGQEGVRHYAAKTLENVLAQLGPLHPLVSELVRPELAVDLLDLARHASCENLKCTAAAGLSHLLGHDILGGECRQDHDDRQSGKINTGSSSTSSNTTRTTRPRTGNAATLDSSENLARAGGRRRQRPASAHDSDRGGVIPPAAPGWITSRVMHEPGAPEAIVQGLSAEGSSAASRRAFLGVFNLVLWASRGDRSRWGEGRPETPREVVTPAAGGGRHTASLRSAVQSMLDSQHLLVRLLRIAEHGEGAVLRAKGFLAVRLALEAASPGFLLRACRSRLLPLLARAIGGLAPRLNAAARGLHGAPVPELTPQQEYLYECSTKLAEWLCAVPETVARRLATELGRLCAREEQQRLPLPRRAGSGSSSNAGGSSRRLAGREQTLVGSATGGEAVELESAVAMFPAVVHLVNSPLLRRRAVTAAFVRDLAECLALSCPAAAAATAAEAGKGGCSDRRIPPEVGPSSSLDGTKAGVLAALLPTVETLAQQSELLLLPHRDTVAGDLIPVLCRLLESPSGDTRALIVAIFRVLLPPLVRRRRRRQPGAAPTGHHPSAQRCPDQTTGETAIGTAAAAGPSSSSSSLSVAEDLVASALVAHFLPLVPGLLRDYDPIPQYTVRLLLDVGREWQGVGPALLEPDGRGGAGGGAAAAALLDRVSRRPRGLSPRRGSGSGRERASAALDPALAALLTLLVETSEQTRSVNRERRRRMEVPERGLVGEKSYSGGGGGRSSYGDEDVFVEFLRLELPGRTAAAVAAAVEIGMPEVTEAYLGLAIALLNACFHHISDAQEGEEASPNSAGVRGYSRAMPASVLGAGGADASAAVVRERDPDMEWQEWQLSPLLSAVPAAVEAVKLFCVQGVLAKKLRQQQQLAGVTTVRCCEGEGDTLGVDDDGARSGVSDAATLFLEMSFKVFGNDLLQSLLLPGSATPPTTTAATASKQTPYPQTLGPSPTTTPPPPPVPAATPESAAQQTRVHRQLADFLGCPDEDQRPRLRVLSLLLAAASRLGQPFRAALRQGPLWTALLRLATGRGGGLGSGKAALGPASALARDVVAAVREGRGCPSLSQGRGIVVASDIGTAGSRVEPHRWSDRGGSGRGRR